MFTPAPAAGIEDGHDSGRTAAEDATSHGRGGGTFLLRGRTELEGEDEAEEDRLSDGFSLIRFAVEEASSLPISEWLLLMPVSSVQM